MTPVLEACGVGRSFGDHRVLDGVDLPLEAGVVTALLGPSGSGKSTLIRILAGFDTLDAGYVRGDGRDFSTPDFCAPPETRDLGVVFQDFALFPHLSALGNVTFGLRHLPKDVRRQRALSLLEAAGLTHRAHALPASLSGGERQRVAVARALAREPRAVLMDEPFSSLDGGLRRATRDHAMALLRASGAAVLLVTHDAPEALATADVVALMDGGQIIQRNKPSQVYAHPASARAAQLTGDINVWRTTAQNGRAETPFGALPTDQDGPVEVLVRPEAISLSSGTQWRVEAVRFLGPTRMATIRLGGHAWRAALAADSPHEVGDQVDLTLSAGAAHITAAQTATV